MSKIKWSGVNNKISENISNKNKVIAGTTGLLIDKRSRVFFPGTFLAFNIIYWATIIIARNIGTEHDHDVLDEAH